MLHTTSESSLFVVTTWVAVLFAVVRPQSLVMSLSALRLRIVITYLHCTNRSKGLEPSMDDKDEDKRQCELYLSNALTVRTK